MPYIPVGVAIAVLYLVIPQLSQGTRDWSWLATLSLAPINSEPALAVAWTLQHEVMFYFVFGLLHFSGFLLPGMLIWAALILTATATGYSFNVPLALINLEFLFGICIAVAFRRGWGHPAWYLASIPPSIAWVYLGAQSQHSVLIGLSFAAVILPTARLERQGRLVVPKLLLFLGSASYAIYLVHGVAISVIARGAASYGWPIIVVLGTLGGTFAGLIYYKTIEQPALRLNINLRHRQKIVTPLLMRR